jgi:hypothetical protein
MRALGFLWVVSSLVALGCATTPVVEGAESDISTVSMSCKEPYILTQDCSAWSGAKRTIKLEGFEIKVAANESGDVILVMDAHAFARSMLEGISLNMGISLHIGKDHHSVASNNSFEAVRRVLAENETSIVRFRPVTSFGNIDGYVLELDSDGYSLLKGYTKED